MKLAIFSDLHLGYGRGSERESDAFETFEEIIEIISQKNVDAVLIPGDIFDSKVPSQEVIANSLELFSKLSKIKSKSNAKLVRVYNIIEKKERQISLLSNLPIITISGTHERRAKNMINPVKILEKAGFVVSLHAEYAVIENEKGEKIAVHGLSGVPEIFARKVIQSIDFKPIEGIKNVFMLHQSIKNFVYMDDDPTLTIEDLPKGFDIIIDGHIHWANELRIKETLFLIPGSTVTTQIRKTESKIPKYIYFYDTENKKLEKVELKTPRLVYYIELECSGKNKEEIKEIIIKKLDDIAKDAEKKSDKKPLVRIILKGVVDSKTAKHNYANFLKPFEEKLIITYSKDLKSKEEDKKKEELSEIMKNSISIEDIIEKLLLRNAESLGINVESFDITSFMDVLESGDIDKAEEFLERVEKNAFEIKEIEKIKKNEEKEKISFKNDDNKERKPPTLFDFGNMS